MVESAGPLHEREGAATVPLPGTVVYNALSDDGTLAGWPVARSETDPCPGPLTIRHLDGTTSTLDVASGQRCWRVTVLSSEFVVTVFAPSQTINMTDWTIVATDLNRGDSFQIAAAKPDQTEQPVFQPTLDGHYLAWFEMDQVPARSGDDAVLYLADLRARTATSLGRGFTNPTLRWPYLFANHFGTDTTRGTVVRIDLRDHSQLDLGLGADAIFLAATSDLLLVVLPEHSELVTFDGHPVAQLPQRANYPAAGEHHLVWSTFPDATHQTRELLDTRCPRRSWELATRTSQGWFDSANGPYIAWSYPTATQAQATPTYRMLTANDVPAC